jgi:hypothetical protein
MTAATVVAGIAVATTASLTRRATSLFVALSL